MICYDPIINEFRDIMFDWTDELYLVTDEMTTDEDVTNILLTILSHWFKNVSPITWDQIVAVIVFPLQYFSQF